MPATPDASMDQKEASKKDVEFRVGKTARSELRGELAKTKDPGKTIREFQQSHSLHTMLATAFDTIPEHKFRNTRNSGVKESLNSDCVMTFLSHLGIQQHDVHKKVADALLKQLQEAVRSKNVTDSKESKQQLLDLLKESWTYAAGTSVPELRDVFITVLKQLGPATPPAALLEVGAHRDIFNQLTDPLKRLCWEADIDKTAPHDADDFPQLLKSTLFHDVVTPLIQEYASKLTSPLPFVANSSERRVVTTQRRRVAVTDLRNVLGKSGKLLYALLALLDPHPTLLGDMLVSITLTSPYAGVAALARTLDEIVQAGTIVDAQLIALQSALRQVLPLEPAKDESTNGSGPKFNIRQVLHRIIPSTGLSAMKAADPQKLFWNPVTDEIAPGYSKFIETPICLGDMYDKPYAHLNEWKSDVLLMFMNCVQYNKGPAGKWFRGEANRQKTVFEKEIFPQVRRLVEQKQKEEKKSTEVAKSEICPLRAGAKAKTKEDSSTRKKDDPLPKMGHIAGRLLSDPFVVRIILDRVLREIRSNAVACSLPAAHSVIPSLLQLLHFGRSTDGVMTGCGLEDPDSIPWMCLRQSSPLLVRLLVETEIDQRTATGGEWNSVRSSVAISNTSLSEEQDVVSNLLFQGALVHQCRERSDLAVTFPKLATAVQQRDKAFLVCLRRAILRHKTKLPKSSRDSILNTWLGWIASDQEAYAVHEEYVAMLNDWAALGNAVLPRDALLHNTQRAVDAIGKENVARLWKQAETEGNNFVGVKRQYERMLKGLPESSAAEWRKGAGIVEKEALIDEKEGDDPMEVDDQQNTKEEHEESVAEPMEE